MGPISPTRPSPSYLAGTESVEHCRLYKSAAPWPGGQYVVSACCMQLARTSYVVLARSPGRCSSIYRITSFDNPHSLDIFCFEGLGVRALLRAPCRPAAGRVVPTAAGEQATGRLSAAAESPLHLLVGRAVMDNPPVTTVADLDEVRKLMLFCKALPCSRGCALPRHWRLQLFLISFVLCLLTPLLSSHSVNPAPAPAQKGHRGRSGCHRCHCVLEPAVSSRRQILLLWRLRCGSSSC